MEYKYEHIEVDDPDDKWLNELARIFAEIIYREMIERQDNEKSEKEIPPVVQR